VASKANSAARSNSLHDSANPLDGRVSHWAQFRWVSSCTACDRIVFACDISVASLPLSCTAGHSEPAKRAFELDGFNI
jgi:hypothetical protein